MKRGRITAARSYTAGELLRLLRARYAPPAFAVFEQVRSSTGFDTVRVIDAIVASLWPSNGLQLHAVEVKVSRADLQRELLDPGKSETFAPFCHKFWLCAPRDIVDPAELPAGWGWLAPYGEGAETVLRAEREATAREAEPMTAPRLMGLLRVASRDGKLIRAERLVEELTAHVEPLRAAVESWRALEEKSKMIKTE